MSAQEILDALRDLTDALQDEMEHFQRNERVFPGEDTLWPLVKRADAIIAKAEGR